MSVPRETTPLQAPLAQAVETDVVQAQTAESWDAAILAAVPQQLPRVRNTTGYRLGLLLVAGGMVMLLAIYIGLILLVLAWSLSGFFNLLGLVVVLFMVKPLFAPPARSPRMKQLRPEAEPLLFAYVERICRAQGSPVPTSIVLNTEVNASASLRSIFSDELTLTIGMPLAAGCTLEQLSGVLAHEFGHFSQRAGMRLSRVVLGIAIWFYRVAFERDMWDVYLIQWSQTGWGVVLYPLRGMIWLTRGALWGLGCVGLAISCRMMQEMEFDADRHEAQLVGSDTFEVTQRKLPSLSLASMYAFKNLSQAYEESRLTDDFPGLIAASLVDVHPALRRFQDRNDEIEETGLFDTHPAARARIANIQSGQFERRIALPTLPNGEPLPSSVLFKNYKLICQELTAEIYRRELGNRVAPEIVRPLEEIVTRIREETAAQHGLRRYFQGQLSDLRPLPMPQQPLAPPTNAKQVAETVRSSRTAVLDHAPSYREAFERYEKADDELLDATHSAAMSQAHCHFFDHSQVGMKQGGQLEAAMKVRDAMIELASTGETMEPFENVASERLHAALSLLHVPQVARRIPDARALIKATQKQIHAAQVTGPLLKDLIEFRGVWQETASLCEHVGYKFTDRRYWEAVAKRSDHLHEKLNQYQQDMGEVLYPLEHIYFNTTLKEYCLPEIPEKENVTGVLQASQRLMQRVMSLHQRVYGRLASTAEKVEQVLSLPPLPDAPTHEDKRLEKDLEELAKKKEEEQEKEGVGLGVVIGILVIVFFCSYATYKTYRFASLLTSAISSQSETNSVDPQQQVAASGDFGADDGHTIPGNDPPVAPQPRQEEPAPSRPAQIPPQTLTPQKPLVLQPSLSAETEPQEPEPVIYASNEKLPVAVDFIQPLEVKPGQKFRPHGRGMKDTESLQMISRRTRSLASGEPEEIEFEVVSDKELLATMPMNVAWPGGTMLFLVTTPTASTVTWPASAMKLEDVESAKKLPRGRFYTVSQKVKMTEVLMGQTVFIESQGELEARLFGPNWIFAADGARVGSARLHSPFTLISSEHVESPPEPPITRRITVPSLHRSTVERLLHVQVY